MALRPRSGTMVNGVPVLGDGLDRKAGVDVFERQSYDVCDFLAIARHTNPGIALSDSPNTILPGSSLKPTGIIPILCEVELDLTCGGVPANRKGGAKRRMAGKRQFFLDGKNADSARGARA